MSILDGLKKYAAGKPVRLHTPGHKGGASELDLTELTDGSFPGGYVESAEEYIASVYGAKHAHLLCGGSSQGVKAAIYYAARDGVIDVNSHRSVRDGFALCGKKFVEAGERGRVTPLTAAEIEAALTPDIGVVVVTSPTYFGYVADIEEIRRLCHERGLLLIVDGAHGAHFGFSPLLPKSVAPVADICNVSAHKTLCALTQSAILLDNLNDADGARLTEAVRVMGSTSPSYLLYASIDHAVTEAASDKTAQAYAALYAPLMQLRGEYPFLRNDDFTRLVLDVGALGLKADRLNAALCARGVYSEMTDGVRIVFIFTAHNTPSDVQRLSEALFDSIREIK